VVRAENQRSDVGCVKSVGYVRRGIKGSTLGKTEPDFFKNVRNWSADRSVGGNRLSSTRRLLGSEIPRTSS